MEATSLVKANDEKSLIPLWSAAKGVVYLLDEYLPVGNQSGRVNRVRSHGTTGWIYVAELRQPPQIGVLIELIYRLAKLSGAAVNSPGEIMGIARAAGTIVGPAVVGLCQLLEDRPLGERRFAKPSIIGTMSVRGSGYIAALFGSVGPGISECQLLKVIKFRTNSVKTGT